MSIIKCIIYESLLVDNSAFEEALESLCKTKSSIYKIKIGFLLVHYEDTCQNLYNNLKSKLNSQRILIFDINYNEYFGYHDSKLWEWMRNQYSQQKQAKKET